jgi:hypothetical protein
MSGGEAVGAGHGHAGGAVVAHRGDGGRAWERKLTGQPSPGGFPGVVVAADETLKAKLKPFQARMRFVVSSRKQ